MRLHKKKKEDEPAPAGDAKDADAPKVYVLL